MKNEFWYVSRGCLHPRHAGADRKITTIDLGRAIPGRYKEGAWNVTGQGLKQTWIAKVRTYETNQTCQILHPKTAFTPQIHDRRRSRRHGVFNRPQACPGR